MFLPFETFYEDSLTEVHLEHWQHFLQATARHQIKIIPTLFDFPIAYDIYYYEYFQRYLENILSAAKSFDHIVAWDIKNEPDLDFQHYGQEVVIYWHISSIFYLFTFMKK